MFRCRVCSSVVPPRTPARRRVVRTRPVDYPPRNDANRHVRKVAGGGRKVFRTRDPGGRGFETVREVFACPACAPRIAEAAGTDGARQ